MAMPSASATSADCIKLTSGASAVLRGWWVTTIEWWSRAPRPRDTISSVASHDSADCLMVIGDLVINYNFSRVQGSWARAWTIVFHDCTVATLASKLSELISLAPLENGSGKDIRLILHTYWHVIQRASRLRAWGSLRSVRGERSARWWPGDILKSGKTRICLQGAVLLFSLPAWHANVWDCSDYCAITNAFRDVCLQAALVCGNATRKRS